MYLPSGVIATEFIQARRGEKDPERAYYHHVHQQSDGLLVWY